ncbi:DUF6126 family protein [Streptomyces sp. NPDC056194]|uniref:DUF6126 family protein n=1 Tax=unclassified Streptomyces TaxID=2593676 RepID=UPI0035E0674B
MAGKTYDNERWKERGVMLRVFVYVFAAHAFAGFVWLLFHVGQNAPKQGPTRAHVESPA